MNDMKIEWRDISELTPYERNAKIHPDEQIDQIANSLEAFGWQQPVVIDKDGVIIVGHGRYLAAEKLTKQGKKKKYRWNDSKPFDWSKVPCKSADTMTEDEIKAYRLADNKLNESPWDEALREIELADIEMDMEQFGFDLEQAVEEFDEEGLDEESDKSNVIVTINCGTALNYETVRERLNNIAEEIGGSIAVKMQ